MLTAAQIRRLVIRSQRAYRTLQRAARAVRQAAVISQIFGRSRLAATYAAKTKTFGKEQPAAMILVGTRAHRRTPVGDRRALRPGERNGRSERVCSFGQHGQRLLPEPPTASSLRRRGRSRSSGAGVRNNLSGPARPAHQRYRRCCLGRKAAPTRTKTPAALAQAKVSPPAEYQVLVPSVGTAATRVCASATK